MPVFASGPALSASGGYVPPALPDLFILTAGQSNAANYAQPLDLTVPGPQVISRGLVAGYSQAFDPQPTADNINSSPWPRLGDLLVARTGRNVRLISVGVGNTRSSEWVPGTPNYQRIRDAIALLAGNIFMFLWHQGENDAAFSVSQLAYTTNVISIIDQIRIDSAQDVPCGIAVATHPNEVTGAGVSAAQIAIGTTYHNCFQGANTDTLGNSFRYDTVHFTTPTGTSAHANLWYNAIVGYFGL